MNKLLRLTLLVLFSNLFWTNVFCQEFYQYFDGQDTIPDYSIIILLDSLDANVWHVGPPQKTIFDQASTIPNVLVTDTINPYPTSDSSSFTFDLDYLDGWGFGIVQLHWNQKLDLDAGNDFGLIEYSFNGGTDWTNVVNDPYVYSFYGYNEENLMLNSDSVYGFTGIDSTWKNVWLCLDASWLSEVDSVKFRYGLETDSVETNQDGWMIDDMMMYIGIVHTVNEENPEEYMEMSPNPTSGRLNINSQKIDGFHIIEKMELMDQSGRMVQEFGISPTKFHIDIGHHPDGVYFLKVKTNVKTETYRIVLQKD